MAKVFEEVKKDMNIWLPQVKDDQIEGKLVEKKEGKYGTQFCIDDERIGRVYTPSHKVVQNRMNDVIIGSFVRIVYTGKEAPSVRGQNPTSMYKVFVAK
jgi:hypothetical protein